MSARSCIYNVPIWWYFLWQELSAEEVLEFLGWLSPGGSMGGVMISVQYSILDLDAMRIAKTLDSRLTTRFPSVKRRIYLLMRDKFIIWFSAYEKRSIMMLSMKFLYALCNVVAEWMKNEVKRSERLEGIWLSAAVGCYHRFCLLSLIKCSVKKRQLPDRDNQIGFFSLD